MGAFMSTQRPFVGLGKQGAPWEEANALSAVRNKRQKALRLPFVFTAYISTSVPRNRTLRWQVEMHQFDWPATRKGRISADWPWPVTSRSIYQFCANQMYTHVAMRHTMGHCANNSSDSVATHTHNMLSMWKFFSWRQEEIKLAIL